MKQYVILSLVLTALLAFGCHEGRKIVVKINNPLDIARTDEILTLNFADLEKHYPDFNFDQFDIIDFHSSLPFEINGNDLLINLSMKADTDEEIILTGGAKNAEAPVKRTQAEISVRQGGRFDGPLYVGGGPFVNTKNLLVPKEHVMHDDFMRYEGPGWESDKVGYRLYLDDRNAIDIFGKKTSDMILQQVGQDASGSYHEMQWWGMDIFKVGDALGIGTLAAFVDGKARRIQTTDSMRCIITEDGNLRSSVQLDFYGWQTALSKQNVRSTLSIQAGSRLTKNTVLCDGSNTQLCTGLIKNEGSKFFTSHGQAYEGWQYIALYGLQSLAGDSLGTAVFYHSAKASEVTEDALSYIVVFNPGLDALNYYFTAAWQSELHGIMNGAEFKKYLDEEISRLNHPLEVTF